MREYTLINGNLLDAKADFICHQVNCQGKMGSGVAKAIRERYDNVYTYYHTECNRHMNKSELLGKLQIVPLISEIEVMYEKETPVKPYYCINMFAQDTYGYDGRQYTSLEAFKTCLEKINNHCKGYTVAFPWMIGCVRGGADWNVILPMILETLTDVKEIIFYKLDLG